MTEDTLTIEEKERLNKQHMRALKVKKMKRMDYETLRLQREGKDQDVEDVVEKTTKIK